MPLVVLNCCTILCRVGC